MPKEIIQFYKYKLIRNTIKFLNHGASTSNQHENITLTMIEPCKLENYCKSTTRKNMYTLILF